MLPISQIELRAHLDDLDRQVHASRRAQATLRPWIASLTRKVQDILKHRRGVVSKVVDGVWRDDSVPPQRNDGASVSP